MDRPNVLLICVEHWPGKMIGALGHPAVLTPTINQMVANGIAFTNAYSTTPMCIPARRELMTGTFSKTHGDRVFDWKNLFLYRDWHLPEYYHYTNWTAREMSRHIVRRDRGRPSFWYMSFYSAHPSLLPPATYMDMYRDLEIDEPFVGDWAQDFDAWPFAAKANQQKEWRELTLSTSRTRQMRQAFYAMYTHVDHQIRAILGLLREQGILDNTIIMLTSDHGEMLGDHGQYNKGTFYQGSANIPMVLMPTPEQAKSTSLNKRDDRLVAQADVMPTLLDLCNVPIPDTVEGLSMVGDQKRDYLYGELMEDHLATRMVHDGRHKLIYYPVGNLFQLFDLQEDPNELRDVADDPGYSEVRTRLTGLLRQRIYGSDLEWVRDGELVGLPEPELTEDYFYNPTFSNVRGHRIR